MRRGFGEAVFVSGVQRSENGFPRIQKGGAFFGKHSAILETDRQDVPAALPVQQRDGGAGAVVVGGEAGQRLCRG